jgi:pyruvate dehydrogenase E1 component alpha subunit
MWRPEPTCTTELRKNSDGMHSILRADGTLAEGAEPSMDEEFLIEALRLMLLSRLYDQRVIGLQRQGRFGVFSPGLGQEAAIVGSALSLDPDRDWIVPQYRELVAVVRHGYPLEKITATYMGKTTEATRIPDGVNVLPTQVALAAQLPHATGLAWGLMLLGKDAVVMAYIGDGGSSEGDFHEALNLAGVQRCPVVFFMQNNQWAISTPRRLQSAAPSFAIRAEGYGFPGVQVDGNDVLAVHQAAVAAVRRARAGEGPTLIEAVTYRMGFHNTTDDPSRYENPEERESARQRDPIERVVTYLTSLGLWSPERDARLRHEIGEELDHAIAWAERQPGVSAELLFDNVYAGPPERVARQRAAYLKDGVQ